MPILLLLLILIIPLVLVLGGNNGKKRGCGRGCATCPSRFTCHPGQYDKKEEET